jgi:hypothetical protein
MTKTNKLELGNTAFFPSVPMTKEELIERMEEISARSAARPIADPRSINEIIDYDDHGVPR